MRLSGRVLLSLGVHAMCGALGLAILYGLMRDSSAMSQAVLNQWSTNPAGLAQAQSDATAELLTWAGAAVLVSWLLASMWLALTDRADVLGAEEAGRYLGPWIGLLLGDLISCGIIGWAQIWRAALDANYAPSVLTTASGVVPLTVLVAFYLGTGLAARRTFRVILPGGPMLNRS